jgi:hypothetical protein
MSMEYPRMKYSNEQRDWVRAAEEKLPGLLEEASKAQKRAAETFEAMQHIEYSIKLRIYWLDLTREAYQEAHMLLNRVLYYEGMRQANLPREE